MAGIKLEVYWSPNNPEKFITWGNEITLYQVEHVSGEDQIPLHYVRLSTNTVAYQLASFNDVSFAKCIAWLPSADVDGFLAVGQTNGRVLLISLLGSNELSAYSCKEYLSKHNRQCNAVAWGVAKSNLLAAGFDKHRSEHGITVWDACRTGNDNMKPVYEIGFGDTVASLAWFTQPSTLIAGVNNKHLRVYDLRDESKPMNVTTTRAAYGVVVDPLVSHRIASFSDSTVCIWDLRNFEKPVLSLQQSKLVSKISWCATRSSFLGVLCKESSSLTLYDIQNTNSTATEEMEPTPLERGVILANNNESISSFAWHMTDENRLLYSTSSLSIKDHTVVDRITLNWSPSSQMVWNFGKRILQYIDEKDSIYGHLEDISVTMRKRALGGYGLDPDFKPAAELMQDSITKELWYWVDTCRQLALASNPLGANFFGVRSALKLDSDGIKSELKNIPWTGVGTCKMTPIGVYRSEDRYQALRLCGWPSDQEASTLGPLLDKLEAEENVSRAAALAVFHMKIRRAIKILTRTGRQNNDLSFQLVALALAGFTDNRDTLWQEMCTAQRSNLTDPYLRASFAFLTSTSDKYDAVLSETGISVRDRVGFACTFLSDANLTEYVEMLNRQLISEGNLDGMLLTGLTNDGLSLLQSYVDRTGDIQTISLLSLHTSTHDSSKDPRMLQWVNSYRTLLDSWRLWTQRAKFDVQLYKCHAPSADKSPQQIYASCNFCGKSISTFAGNKSRMALSRTNPNVKAKLSGCPNCRNPLPRCAVCMMHLGSPLASWGGPTKEKKAHNSGPVSPIAAAELSKNHPFSSWILWCQSCRHGGHSAHLLEWFSEHPECPVTGCTCRCLNLDAIGHQIPLIAHGNG